MGSVFSIKINETIYEVDVGDVSESPVMVNVGEEKFEVEFEEHGVKWVKNAPSTVEKPDTKPVSKNPGTSVGDSKVITSPMPGKVLKINVKAGDSVTSQQVVCVIEAMKLFNEIEAEISGKIVKVLVDDSTPVEYDQPLFLVDPS